MPLFGHNIIFLDIINKIKKIQSLETDCSQISNALKLFEFRLLGEVTLGKPTACYRTSMGIKKP